MCLTVKELGNKFRKNNPDVKTVRVWKALEYRGGQWKTLVVHHGVSPGDTIHARAFRPDWNGELISSQGVHAYVSYEAAHAEVHFLPGKYCILQCEVPVEDIIAFGDASDIALFKLTLPTEFPEPIQVHHYSQRL